ncbi:MAG: AMP-binding protein [Candidatus Zixiibacteriota bacterium]
MTTASAPTTIPELILTSTLRWPARPALWRWRDGALTSVSYGALVGAAVQLSQRLRTYGAGPDRRVGIWVPDRFSWGVAYLGVLWSGATAIPVDPLLTPGEARAILEEADPSLLITAGATPILTGRGTSLPIVRLSQIWPEFVEPTAALPPAPTIDPEAIASILFTSGTSGTTKGVMLSHANIVADIAAVAERGLLTSRDKLLSILPIHHAFECTMGFLYPLSQGAQVAFARGLKSGEILADLKATGATEMIGVPLLFEKIAKGIRHRVSEAPRSQRLTFALCMALSRAFRRAGWRGAGRWLFRGVRQRAGIGSLRLLTSGAAALPPDVAEFFDTVGLPLVQGYGLSEAAPAVAVDIPGRHRYDTVGPPLPMVQVTIRDPRPDGVGEILVKGPMIMKGYWRRPAETATVIRDGWLLTGDLGTLDRDGRLRIVGRSKNVIISGAGKNIYPEELEAVLGDQPGILESVVYGRSRPGRIGEAVAAVIVPDREWFETTRPEALTDEALLRELIAAAVRNACERLAPYKRVVEWELRREPLEKTSTRKIKRLLVTAQGVAEPAKTQAQAGT